MVINNYGQPLIRISSKTLSMTGITVWNGFSSLKTSCVVTYLSIRDSSVSIFVYFFNELVHFFLTYIEASRFDESSKFFSADSSIVIKVTAYECFIEVETRSLVESLSQAFRIRFNLEVSSPHGFELNLSLTEETIISLVKSASCVV